MYTWNVSICSWNKTRAREPNKAIQHRKVRKVYALSLLLLRLLFFFSWFGFGQTAGAQEDEAEKNFIESVVKAHPATYTIVAKKKGGSFQCLNTLAGSKMHLLFGLGNCNYRMSLYESAIFRFSEVHTHTHTHTKAYHVSWFDMISISIQQYRVNVYWCMYMGRGNTGVSCTAGAYNRADRRWWSSD